MARSSSKSLNDDLVRQGFDVNRLRSADLANSKAVETVRQALVARKLDFRLDLAKNLRAVPPDTDLVITVGGDGTVLETAQLIGSPKIPLLAVNSDPLTSTGKLCSVALHKDTSFERTLDLVLRGHYTILTRQRINVDVIDTQHRITRVPRPALNEVFYSEVDANRPSKQELTVVRPGPDDLAVCALHRSSGLLVSTGSGSTAWVKSASAMHAKDVQRILRAAGCPHATRADAIHIAERLNDEFVFHPDDRRVLYYVRDPMFNYDMRPDEEALFPHHGFALSVSVRSLGFDSMLALDGLYKYPVMHGETVVMRVDPETALNCVMFE